MTPLNLERTTGGFNLSIGTDLMLESLFTPVTRFDPDRDIPNNLNPNSYKIHYFNIYTLARNIVNAHSGKDVRQKVTASDYLFNILLEEVSILAELYSNVKCIPVLFIPDYTTVYKGINLNKNIEVPHNEVLLQNYINHHLKGKNIDIPMEVLHNTYRIKPTISNILITTHIGLDLIAVNKSPNLYLLESHTGKLKDKKLFYTKYHKIGKLELDVFPMIEELMYILGDGKVSMPMKLTIRRKLYNLAKDKKWTQYTGRPKIMSDMLKDDIIGPIIKDYQKHIKFLIKTV